MVSGKSAKMQPRKPSRFPGRSQRPSLSRIFDNRNFCSKFMLSVVMHSSITPTETKKTLLLNYLSDPFPMKWVLLSSKNISKFNEQADALDFSVRVDGFLQGLWPATSCSPGSSLIISLQLICIDCKNPC